jgi:hypothetical protein
MAKFVVVSRNLVEQMLSKLGGKHRLVKIFRSNKENYKKVLSEGFTRTGPKGGKSSKTLKGLVSGKRVAMPSKLFNNMAEASGVSVPSRYNYNVASKPRVSKTTKMMREEVAAEKQRGDERLMSFIGAKVGPPDSRGIQQIRGPQGKRLGSRQISPDKYPNKEG